MSTQDRTIIVVDDELDFSPEEFVLNWNAESSQEDLPLASLLNKEQTFDTDWMRIIGDVANVIQIISFIGVPTVEAIVQKIIKARAKGKLSRDEVQKSCNFEIDEKIIDLGQDGKVQQITIRRRVGLS